MVGFWIRAGKTIVGTKPKVKFKGQSTIEAIKKKGKEFKKKIADDERKEAMTRYFTNQPPKKTKPWKKMKISKKEYDDIPF